MYWKIKWSTAVLDPPLQHCNYFGQLCTQLLIMGCLGSQHCTRTFYCNVFPDLQLPADLYTKNAMLIILLHIARRKFTRNTATLANWRYPHAMEYDHLNA